MHRRPLAAALALLMAPPLVAQEPPSPPVFRSQAELVIVDVVVTDSKGELVRGLTKDDFVVYEDGAPQGVETFEAIDLPGNVSARVAEAPMRSALSTNSGGRSERATLVVTFDELHLAPATTEMVRRQLDDVWRQGSLGPADVLLFSTAGGGSWLGRLPEDAEAMQRALDRFRGSRFDAISGRMTDYEAFLIAARHDDRVLTEVYRRYLDQQFMPDPTDILPDRGRAAHLLPARLRSAGRARGRQVPRAQGGVEASWPGARSPSRLLRGGAAGGPIGP